LIPKGKAKNTAIPLYMDMGEEKGEKRKKKCTIEGMNGRSKKGMRGLRITPHENEEGTTVGFLPELKNMRTFTGGPISCAHFPLHFPNQLVHLLISSCRWLLLIR
jgi:hypothetical protein